MPAMWSRYGMATRALIAGLALMLAPSLARAEVSEVRIGVQFGLVYLPITVAEAQGFFAEEAKKAGLPDLKVTVTRFSGSTAISDAFLSGNVDIGAWGVPALLIMWDVTKGRYDVHGLAALAAHPFILETNKPEIKTLADFGESDRIAVPSATSPQAILMRIAAEKLYGPGQHKKIDTLLISMPHPEATTALLAGKTGITGYVATPPFIAPLKKSDKIHAVIASKEILDGEEVTGAALGTSQKFASENPAVAKAVIAALDDAIRFIKEKPDAAADIYIKSESSKMTKPDVLEMLSDGTMLYDTVPSGIMKFATFMARTGQLKSEPKSWEDVFFPLLGGRKGG
jgi:NitT/TauT family transport system substrate-binding protein